ncbi:MAG TPA: PBSX family phage terminase large subunit [Helicobacter sp.]|nr:PBSX family phage terminase large subunit [Helicobacter sp.]
MKLQIPHKFEPLFKGDYVKQRVITYYGGRGGGKSVTLSYFCILKCLQSRIRFYVVRKVDKSKANSTHSLVKRLLRENGFMEYVVQISNDRILFSNGSEVIFEGINERTIDNLRSADNVSYFWFDEAHDIQAETMQVLIPSVRADDSQIIISLNPQKSDDFVYTRYIKGADNEYSVAVRVNYSDNPFFPKVLERDRLKDYETLPRPIYLHIWEGETNDYNDMQVIDTDRIGFYDTYADYSYICLSIDTATSTKTGADYSVIGVFGKVRDSKDCHIIHLARGRWDWHTLNTKIQEIYNLTHTLTKRNANIILVEAKANGLNVIQELQRLTHIQVKGITPTTDKVSRVVNGVLPFLDNLKLPQDSTNPFNFWVNDYIAEARQFRADGKHAHDDMIDSTSQALNFLYNNAFDFEKIREALSK